VRTTIKRKRKEEKNKYLSIIMSDLLRQKNTGKKISVVSDDLNIKGSGIYCFLPFERLDIHKKAIFKIGITTSLFSKRLEGYHTYFPLGVYMVAFLENPIIPKVTRSNPKKDLLLKTYLEIERFIFSDIIKHGGERIYSTTRVKYPNERNEGETEWIYCNQQLIHNAFQKAKEKYGGIKHQFHLDGINQIAKRNENSKPNYIAEIVFHP
jgi:hypothetical protein